MAKTIFVIDDERGVLDEMREWLQEFGYRVLAFSNGTDALRYFDTFNPQLVILDVIMPKIDGFDLLAHLKSSPRTADIPVIMLSAKRESSTILRAQSLHASDYVTKPFESDDFLHVIQKYV